MRIVLIGFRGTGKSVIAKEISKELKLKYISTDSLIKQSFNLSVSKIVEEFGWRKFRSTESKIIEDLKNLDNIIIDSGGGSILTKKNRMNLKRKSIVIQLHASEEAIMKRISAGKDRPKLTAIATMREEISGLINERKELYDSITDFKIDTSMNSFEKSKNQIIKYIKGLV
jgi:shikimate kinase